MPAEPSGLVLSPSEHLKFRFELRKQIPTVLTLTNNGTAAIAFKVKTTSPKKYCVRPNTGIVAAGSTAEVQVIMQQQKEYPPDLQNCKDKFLVQSVAVDSATAEALKNATKDYAELFSHASGIAEAKLRVTFTQPAAPPSPVPEDAEGETGEKPSPAAPYSTPGGADNSTRHELTKAQLVVESADKRAAQADRARLQKELAELKLKFEGARADASFKQMSKPANRVAVPFTLLHLLLTAIIAFCLGRFT